MSLLIQLLIQQKSIQRKLKSKQMWIKTEFNKGSNTLSGYIAEHYYLQLDQNMESCVATDGDDTLRQGDEVGVEYRNSYHL